MQRLRRAQGMIWAALAGAFITLCVAARAAAPPPTGPELAGKIAGIDPANPTSFGPLLGAAAGLDAAKSAGSVSPSEAGQLTADLQAKFSSWVRSRADDLDPSVPDLRPFFDLQMVQGMSEYDELTDPATKAYKEQQLTQKFNDFVRNRVDEIDPSDPNSLKAFFELQTMQGTDKYEELATADTHAYKEEQMGQKFNEWVRNRVDEIDPSDPNSLKAFFDLQVIQGTEKYEEFATAETLAYKEQQMGEKFNEWVRNRVDELDPNDPDYLNKLEMLRIIQETEKYERFATAETRAYKEPKLKETFGAYVTRLVDALDPAQPSFMSDLAALTHLQQSDLYDELCPASVKLYKSHEVARKLAKPPGQVPDVVGMMPACGAPGVSIRQQVVLALDQPMQPPSMLTAVSLLPPVPFELTGLDENHVWVLEHDAPLFPGAPFQVRVGGWAMSLYGVPLLDDYACPFMTEPPGPIPHVVSTVPSDRELEAPGSEPIAITFDQPMWPASVEANLTVAPAFGYSAQWREGGDQLTLHLHQPLTSDTWYTVGIGAGAESEPGVALGAPFELRFLTGIHGVPRVLGSVPANAQEGIPANHPVRIVFDRPMDAASVESALAIAPAFAHARIWLEAGFVLWIEPLFSLAFSVEYTVSIGAAAESTFGIPMESPWSFSFTTDERLYPRPVQVGDVRRSGAAEVLVDPGEAREYVAHLATGAELPVHLFRAEELAALVEMVNRHRAGESVPTLRSTAYDRERQGVIFHDDAGPEMRQRWYSAVFEP